MGGSPNQKRPWTVWAAAFYFTGTAGLAVWASIGFLNGAAAELAGVCGGIFVLTAAAVVQMLWRPTPWVRRYSALLLGLMGLVGLGASLMALKNPQADLGMELARLGLSAGVLGLYLAFGFGAATRRHFGSPVRWRPKAN